ncbi:MAG: GYD domain protein [Syntrophus sp. PtaB.Bin075]|nr:MAG: GYD domain protein [Syntrophus sp. PtaB.Bin075]
MSIFFMFGKYSTESLKEISPERTQRSIETIKKLQGEVRSMYTLLGEHDLVLIVDFPSVEKAMMASVALQRLTGIAFTTSPVVDVEEFDRMIGQVKDI